MVASNSTPIGVFDSGVGGLSVLRCVHDVLPNEDLIYIADLHHVPYGDKTQEFIEQQSIQMVDFLVRRNAKAIVVACNTATMSAIQTLRVKFSMPIIGVEPGIKPAINMSKTGVVGVLATNRTLDSQGYGRLHKRFSMGIQLEVQPCPGLVEQVEALNLTGLETRRLVKHYVNPLLNKGADTIVLGCTHYSFLSPLIKDMTGGKVKIIDTGTAVAKQVKRRLDALNLRSNSKNCGKVRFFVNGWKPLSQNVIGRLWGEDVGVSHIHKPFSAQNVDGSR